MFEPLLEEDNQPVQVKLALYKLLNTFIDLNYAMITEAIAQMTSFVSTMVADYEKFDSNSVMLFTLNQLFISISASESEELL